MFTTPTMLELFAEARMSEEEVARRARVTPSPRRRIRLSLPHFPMTGASPRVRHGA